MDTKLRFYLESMRLRTLPLSVSGIIMGGMLATSRLQWDTGVFSWALLTALSLQILSNIANELGDLQKGTDNEHRLGPIRSVQRGKLTEKNLSRFLLVFIVLSALFGLCLIWTAFDSFLSIQSWIMILLGSLTIVAAIKYTFGQNAYGYIGLGDLFVFIFFGIVSVVGVYFLMAKSIYLSIFLPASSIGLLSTAMLNQNNMRDIDNDTNFKKKTLAGRMGLKSAKVYHFALITLAFVLMSIYSIIQKMNAFGYLYVLTFPVFAWHLHSVFGNEGKTLDKQMKVISIGTILFSLAGGIGFVLGR
ncbi:MAG: 1,4-dihydroxy-2-naphthoate octaprenyltransferase [Paludibacteraceae bacterium]